MNKQTVVSVILAFSLGLVLFGATSSFHHTDGSRLTGFFSLTGNGYPFVYYDRCAMHGHTVGPPHVICNAMFFLWPFVVDAIICVLLGAGMATLVILLRRRKRNRNGV
jgi:hypothetical protein